MAASRCALKQMAVDSDTFDDRDDFVDDEDEQGNASDASDASDAPEEASQDVARSLRQLQGVRASGLKRSHSEDEGISEEEEEDEGEEEDQGEEEEELVSEEEVSDDDESYKAEDDDEDDDEDEEDEDDDFSDIDPDDKLVDSDGELESLADSEEEDDDESQQKHDDALYALLQDKIDSIEALCDLLKIDEKTLSNFVGASVILRNISPMEHISYMLSSHLDQTDSDQETADNEPYNPRLCDSILHSLRLMGLQTDDLHPVSLARAVYPLRYLQFKKRETFIHEALKLVPDGGVVCKVLLHLGAAMAIVIGAHAASTARTLAHQKREEAGALLEIVFGSRCSPEMADADPLAEQARTSTWDELMVVGDRVTGWIQSANNLSDADFVRRIMVNVAQLSQKPRALRRAQRNAARTQKLPIYKGYYDDTYKYHVNASAVKRQVLAVRVEVRIPSDNTGGWWDRLNINSTHFRLRFQGKGFLGIPATTTYSGATAGIASMSYTEGQNLASDHVFPEPSQNAPAVAEAVVDRPTSNKRRKLPAHSNSVNPSLVANLLQTALSKTNMSNVIDMIKDVDGMKDEDKPTDDDVKQILRLQGHEALENAVTSTLQTLPSFDENEWIMTARAGVGGVYLKPFRGLMCSSVHPIAWARLAKRIAKYHGLVTVVLAPKVLLKDRRFGATYDRRQDNRSE